MGFPRRDLRGWWNWDASEVLGLIVSLICLTNIHSLYSTNNIFQNNERFFILILLFILTYFFIQLNFDLISHNFGSKFTHFFNNSLFFMETLLMLTFALYLYIQLLYYSRAQCLILINFRYNTLLYKWLFVFNMYLVFSIILISSFIPLFNYFFWNYLKLDSFNFYIPIHTLLIYLVILLSSVFSTRSLYNYFIILLMTMYAGINVIFVIVFTSLFSIKYTPLIHSILILLSLINFKTYSTSFIQWCIFASFDKILSSEELLYIMQQAFTCDNFVIETLITFNNINNSCLNSWNMFYRINSQSLNSFLLCYDSLNTLNVYILNNSWFNIVLIIEINLINNIIDLLITTIIVLVILKTMHHFIRY